MINVSVLKALDISITGADCICQLLMGLLSLKDSFQVISIEAENHQNIDLQ